MKRIGILLLVCLLLAPSALAAEGDAARHEAQLKELLHNEMGMPRDAELKAYRGVIRTGQETGGFDARPRYGQSFHAADRLDASWYGWMALEGGALICAEAHYNDDWISMKEERHMDPAAPKWEAMAREHVESMRTRGLADLRETVNEGETAMNGVWGVSFRFVFQDGGTYTVRIVYALNQVVEVIYRDAACQKNYEETLKKQKIVNE